MAWPHKLIHSLIRYGIVASASLLLGFTQADAQVTNIAIGAPVQPSVKAFGINLGIADYYDAGQINKNLVSRNPGFEGEIYQSTIRCASGTSSTCQDDDLWSGWPSGFWNGATFEVFYGAAQGRTGTIANYTPANGTTGGTFTFAAGGTAPATGDYMIVRMTVPGNATAGWWPTTSGNGTITTNTSDLPPGTTGLQTAAINAPTGSDSANINAYFDGDAGRSFMLLNGTYQLSFEAKGTGGSNAIALNLQRLGLATYLNQTVNLTSSWATYNFTFTAAESGSTLNNVELTFGTIGQDSFYLDNVSLTQINSSPSNTTTFRDPLVSTLQTLAPGSLRFWANQLGDSLDNLIADQFGRQRSGFSAFANENDDISYGLHEFLGLSEAVGAEPWVVVPATFTTTDASNLIEYLAGSSSTPYGAKRAGRGHPNPWTSSFTKIHLEFGNEAWNSVFKGGSIEYQVPYGQRAQAIFGAMRANAAYSASSFDLVLGGQAVWAGRNTDIQNNCNNNDSFTVAPYMMNTVDSFSNNEDLFGSTFAEPEAYISPNGVAEGVTGGLMTLNQQAIQASDHPVPLVMYEMNMSTLQGSITQAALNSYASSLGAGLAVVDAMFQQMRQGVLTQNLWNLTQYNFTRPDGSIVDLWGAVVDMGVTDQRRPQFLALQLANQAIGKNAALLQTVHSGADPTWNQPLVNTVQMAGAHDLQSFAFSNSSGNSLAVFNLSRTSALPVTFSGANAPSGTVQMTLLTSANLTDTNETAEVISPVTSSLANFNSSAALSLPPYSMTVLTWTNGSSIPTPPTNPTSPTNPTPPTAPSVIASVGGAGANTGSASAPTSLSISYVSSSNNTIVAVCALGSTSSSISSITDSGSTWAMRGYVNNGTAVRSEIWSTPAGGSVASSTFTINISGGVPTSCALEEYSGVAALGKTATAQATSGTWSVTLATQDPNNYVVAGLGANSYFGYSNPIGTKRQVGILTNNAGNNFVEMALFDNTSSTASNVTNSVVTAPSPWAAPALELRSGGTTPASIPVITSVTATGISSTSATITWTTDQASSSQVAYGTTPAHGSLSTLNPTLGTSHSVSLTGLTAGTTYNYAVMSTDSAGTATSANFTFSTAASIPVISGVTATGITSSSATITWTTDQASSSQVAYGATPAYGSSSTLNPTLGTSHSVSLTGLTAGTTYNYAVMSTDSAGTATSGNFTFSTAASIPVISGVTAAGITSSSATITWTTDQASSSQVAYGATPAYGSSSTLNPTLGTSHSVSLTGLTAGTTYNYAVMSTDSAGTATSGNFTFSTAASIPVISGVTAAGITSSSATITWTTDQASSSQVAYGATPAYGSSSTLNPTLGTAHSVTLSGLTASTTYNYAVMSTDSAGTATSANFTFSTPAIPAPSVIAPVGGAGGNTGSASTPTSLSISYKSSSNNTVVAVCALGSTSSSISSISDSGSTWALRGFVNNGTAVRSEIWSTPASGSVASSTFTISISGGVPASCALEEYSGVLALGNTSTAQATSGTWSVSVATQDPNNYVVAGLGANSYYGYSNSAGTKRQSGTLTNNAGNDYVEMALFDNTSATPSGVSCSVVTGPAPWAAPALELRSAKP